MAASKFSVCIMERGFTNPLTMPGVKIIPERYSVAAIGGPKAATLNLRGNERGLWEMLEWIRCPVEILDERMSAVWWGYIHGTEINTGRIRVGISLDDVYNRVAIAYSYVPPGTNTVGTRATTTWAQDDDSAAYFGTKELLASAGGMTPAQAEAKRDNILAACKYIKPVINFASGGGAVGTGKITCRGWWNTLGWKYYGQASTTDTETTAQIAAIIAASGQFLTGTFINPASGLSGSALRRGDRTALAEIEDLLAQGKSGGRRLLATVTNQREVVVNEEAASSNFELYLKKDSRVENKWGDEAVMQTCPVGWAKLKDVIPSSLDMTRIADPSMVYIEEASYDVARQRYIPTPKGERSVWEMMQLVEG